jgi:hypothetical protein
MSYELTHLTLKPFLPLQKTSKDYTLRANIGAKNCSARRGTSFCDWAYGKATMEGQNCHHPSESSSLKPRLVDIIDDSLGVPFVPKDSGAKLPRNHAHVVHP